MASSLECKSSFPDRTKQAMDLNQAWNNESSSNWLFHDSIRMASSISPCISFRETSVMAALTLLVWQTETVSEMRQCQGPPFVGKHTAQGASHVGQTQGLTWSDTATPQSTCPTGLPPTVKYSNKITTGWWLRSLKKLLVNQPIICEKCQFQTANQ